VNKFSYLIFIQFLKKKKYC
jgi:hypothetical protein